MSARRDRSPHAREKRALLEGARIQLKAAGCTCEPHLTLHEVPAAHAYGTDTRWGVAAAHDAECPMAPEPGTVEFGEATVPVEDGS